MRIPKRRNFGLRNLEIHYEVGEQITDREIHHQTNTLGVNIMMAARGNLHTRAGVEELY